MSDSIEDLARRYVEDIHGDQHPRSIGLFPIPEYPELEAERGMWSSALDAILTTLRYLAPATLLTLFWGQQSFLFTLLKYIDNAFRAIVFSSEEQKQAVLQWLNESGPVRVEHLDTVWRHGWILCSVLDGFLPGACAGHPPTRLSLKHAQAIADHYLGVERVFSRQELETNDSLSRHQEWKLATYLDRVREALSKITPPVSKPTSQRTSPETTQFTLDYIAKGSGLTAAQVNHKMSFKIYPTSQQALDPGEVTILIRGPKDIYGMTVLPPILGKAQKIRQKILGLQTKQSLTENALPITQGATYLRTYGKNDMNKTYFIPKSIYDIEIETNKREDHTKVFYTVPLEGKYEVSITSRGHNIVGSPYNITASYNILGILEKENFCLEDGEEIDIVDVKTDRKVVLRIVDFVTEKMLLRENGTLEKISEDEAKLLMNTDVETERSSSVTEIIDHVSRKETKVQSITFNKVAHRVLKMNRVCKAFNDIRNENKKSTPKAIKKDNTFRTQTDIPDVVNSTLSDANPFNVTEKRDKYIVPENISVSIRTEKAKPYFGEEIKNTVVGVKPKTLHSCDHAFSLCTPDSLEKISDEQTEEDNNSVDRMTPLSSNNPFLGNVCEDFAVEKKLGTFVKTEFERNNSLNEETRDSSIKIIIEKHDSPITITNPFFDNDIRDLVRPKTPVYKIITGDVLDRVDSPYLDPKSELIPKEILGNEFVNPFFDHQLQSNQHFDQPPVTDFIIGAPVSLPPIVKAPSPEPVAEIVTSMGRHDSKSKTKVKDTEEDITSSLAFSTPKKSNLQNSNDKIITSSTFHSLDSSLTDTTDNCNASTSSDNQFEPYRMDTMHDRDQSPRKDLWDSAYVSIDDNNSSPDTNNNDNATITDIQIKQQIFIREDNYEAELSNMGPAERELWQTCGELKDTHKFQEEPKPYRWEVKRPIFTPIIEESDRSISSSIKNTSLVHQETDPVTVAFAELNNVYQEYFPNSENTLAPHDEDNKLQSNSIEVENTIDNIGVESASELLSDVIRHPTEQEGMISEVQSNVTESVSASQPLHNKMKDKNQNFVRRNKDETQFGDKRSNIVLEKKKYWDEKIRQIEEKSEESSKYHKKRRISTKQLKQDSLSKRKGKQIAKTFLNASTDQKAQLTRQISINKPEVVIQEPVSNREQVKSNEKLVKKWKRYWDEKLVTENDEFENEPKLRSPRSTSKSPQRNKENTVLNTNKVTDDKLAVPTKQELPEEVFKAFETSPKRFFGTSRKHILNKLDTFVGKPITVVKNSPVEIIEVSQDSGLVSSRISLFHNMTNTEPLPWTPKKSQSMHNIFQRKISDKMLTSPEGTPDHTNNKMTENVSNVISTGNLQHSSGRDTIKTKRAKLTNISFNQSFDEIEVRKSNVKTENENLPSPKVMKKINQPSKPTHIDKYKKENILRKTSISKSEMDILRKIPSQIDDGLDKHKSYDELPKINVKNFISLYENATKISSQTKCMKRIDRQSSIDSQLHSQSISVNKNAENGIKSDSTSNTPELMPRQHSRVSRNSESTSVESLNVKAHTEPTDLRRETTYISLSDLELEIVESSPDKSSKTSPEMTEQPHIDYKNRFKSAKQFFQSLEELRENKKPRKLNECEILLLNKSSESLENEKPQKKLNKKKKSHSMPSSELAKYWTQMQEEQKGSQKEENKESKLVKISEKFHVDDLFSDVMEGKLSRQGSLRGIPHKKAVLEAFRSMENISDGKLSPYDIKTTQLSDFPEQNKARTAQTYLKEYPYLPTTDPSKYQSRLDAKASGLITLKELLDKKRRNSVPDLRLNTKFSAEL